MHGVQVYGLWLAELLLLFPLGVWLEHTVERLEEQTEELHVLLLQGIHVQLLAVGRGGLSIQQAANRLHGVLVGVSTELLAAALGGAALWAMLETSLCRFTRHLADLQITSDYIRLRRYHLGGNLQDCSNVVYR